jgi:hypothetical protein
MTWCSIHPNVADASGALTADSSSAPSVVFLARPRELLEIIHTLDHVKEACEGEADGSDGGGVE